MPLLTDGCFLPVVFSKFDSKYWNNFNCGRFAGHVNRRCGIKLTNLTPTQKVPMISCVTFAFKSPVGLLQAYMKHLCLTFMFPDN